MPGTGTFLVVRLLLVVGVLATICGNRAAASGEVATTSSSVCKTNGTSHGHSQDCTNSSQEQHNDTEHEREHVSVHVARFDFVNVRTPFVIAFVVLCSSIAKLGFHSTKISSYIPESCLLIVVGLIIGGFLSFNDEIQELFRYTPRLFFQFLLPPIVLEAGYLMHKRYFFGNIGSILMYAVVGTLWNTFSVALALYAVWAAGGIHVENLSFVVLMLMGTVSAAVDPVAVLAIFDEVHVNLLLYILVFGESLLNDAVSVVLYRTAETFVEFENNNQLITGDQVVLAIVSFFTISLGGTFIGIAWGMFASLITRFTDHVRVIETLMVFVCGYLAYICAEIFHFSGIMSGIACGVVMRHYLNPNVTPKSRTTIKYCLKMLSSGSETIIFLFLGLASVNTKYEWDTGLCIGTLVFAFVFRFIGVFVLTWLLNKKRADKISFVDQFIMGYGGLRGAVSYSLVLLLSEEAVPAKNAIFTAIFTLVMFTVFVQGTTVKPLVHRLHVQTYNPKKTSINQQMHEKMMDHVAAGIETIIGEFGHHFLTEYFIYYDNKFLKPFLSRSNQHLVGSALARLEKHFHCQTTHRHLEDLRRRSRDILAEELKGNIPEDRMSPSPNDVCPVDQRQPSPVPIFPLPTASPSKSLDREAMKESVTSMLFPSKPFRPRIRHNVGDDDHDLVRLRLLRLRAMGDEERASHHHGSQHDPIVRSASDRNLQHEELCERRSMLVKRRCASEYQAGSGDSHDEAGPMVGWLSRQRSSEPKSLSLSSSQKKVQISMASGAASDAFSPRSEARVRFSPLMKSESFETSC